MPTAPLPETVTTIMQMRGEFSIASPSVAVSEIAVTIDHLVVGDLPTRDYLASFDGIAHVDAAVNCFQVGARALAFAHDRSNVAALADTLASTTDATRTVLECLAKTAAATVTASTEAVPKHVNQLLDRVRIDLQATLDPANTPRLSGSCVKR